MEKDVILKQLEVSLNVIKVDGKLLIKRYFDQIDEFIDIDHFCVCEEILSYKKNEIKLNVLGYTSCKKNDKWYIFEFKGMLYKVADFCTSIDLSCAINEDFILWIKENHEKGYNTKIYI